MLALRVLQRLGSGVFVLWGAVTMTFFVLEAMPGKTVDIIAGTQNYPGLHQAIIRQWGLNASIPDQYWRFMDRLVHGNLGTSYVLRQPVSTIVGSAILPTAELALSASVLAVLLALFSAVLTAGRFKALRSLISTIEMVLTSIPVFWIGILLLLLFSFRLHWFPVAGASGIRALVLPAVSLALGPAAVLSQILRESLEAALIEPFVTTARARGLSESAVRWRHALRHALLPVVSLSGSLVAALLGGAVITEEVFGREGLGSVILTAVEGKDIPVVLVVVLLITLIYVVVSTAVDIVYVFLDVRMRSDLGAE